MDNQFIAALGVLCTVYDDDSVQCPSHRDHSQGLKYGPKREDRERHKIGRLARFFSYAFSEARSNWRIPVFIYRSRQLILTFVVFTDFL
jgi:hypothetical protein